MRLLSILTWLISAALCATAQSIGDNPVLDKDFPDPTVIRAAGKYYAYATNGNGKHIQVASSTDLVHWQEEGDALPQKPAWASRDFWAPHVLYDPATKKYVMCYSAESTDENTGKCLGVAFADNPAGPFVDKGSPLLCGKDFEVLDPMAFIDPSGGKKLLYWGSGFQPIKVQELSDDWRSFKPGTTAKAVVWPGKENSYDRLVEGAWVTHHKGWYYLYYSGDNCCGKDAHYAVMVARAKSPFGPFERFGEKHNNGSSVILEKNADWLAPGHNSIVEDEKGNEYIAYHAIRTKGNDHGRVMLIDRITYKNGWPVVVRKTSPLSSNGIYRDTVVDAFFRRSNGWIASDGALTVPLADGRVLWLYGDAAESINGQHVPRAQLIGHSGRVLLSDCFPAYIPVAF